MLEYSIGLCVKVAPTCVCVCSFLMCKMTSHTGFGELRQTISCPNISSTSCYTLRPSRVFTSHPVPAEKFLLEKFQPVLPSSELVNFPTLGNICSRNSQYCATVHGTVHMTMLESVCSDILFFLSWSISKHAKKQFPVHLFSTLRFVCVCLCHLAENTYINIQYTWVLHIYVPYCMFLSLNAKLFFLTLTTCRWQQFNVKRYRFKNCALGGGVCSLSMPQSSGHNAISQTQKWSKKVSLLTFIFISTPEKG